VLGAVVIFMLLKKQKTLLYELC